MAKTNIVETARRNLVRYRKERGYTQTELAKRMGVNQRVVAYYENEAADVPISKLQAFADGLEVSIAALVGEYNVPKEPPEQIDIRLIKKLKSIERLPRRSRDALWHTINTTIESYRLKKELKG